MIRDFVHNPQTQVKYITQQTLTRMQNNHYSSPDSYETINVYKINNQRYFLNIIFYETVGT
jgi:hypothetical protein